MLECSWAVSVNRGAQRLAAEAEFRLSTSDVTTRCWLLLLALPTLLSILSRWWNTAGSSSQGLYRSRRYVKLQARRNRTPAATAKQRVA